MLPHGGEVRSAQVLTGDLSTERFHHSQRLIHSKASFGQVPTLSLETRDVVLSRPFAATIFGLSAEHQRSGVIIEGLCQRSPSLKDVADKCYSDGITAQAFLTCVSRQR